MSAAAPPAGWTVWAFVPWTSPFDGLSDAVPVLILVAVASIAVLASASHMVARNLSRRFSRQVMHAREIESGNFDSKIGDDIEDEIGELSQRLDQVSVRLKQLIRENYEAGQSQKAAELRALQAQINPHMLYNTLATVYWMALDIEALDIAEVTDSLIRYFRYSLNKGNELISVEDEVEQIRAYLKIQHYRFKEEVFSFSIEISPEIGCLVIPKLILQPFVENALIHGMEGLGRPGLIRISGSASEGTIYLAVEDDGVGMDDGTLETIRQGSLDSGGYGISNVRRRLAMRYGERASCQVGRREGGGTRVSLELPSRPE
jgi:two-component system sensor histidine kinase YesM